MEWNKCGKKISEIELDCNDLKFKHLFGYPSKYDMTIMEFNLCMDCIDKLLLNFYNECSVSPEWKELDFDDTTIIKTDIDFEIGED